MPALSGGDLTAWRTAPYRIQTDVFIHAPATVFAARVNQASFTYPLASITFDTVTAGAYTAIQEGQLILFGTAAGKDDLGRTRVRKTLGGVVASSTVLYLQRSSNGTRDGEVNPADNMYLTVLDLRKPWSIAPYIDENGVTYMDTDKTFAHARSFPPIANGDPDVLIVVRDGATAVDVPFGNVAHLVTNPDATASVTHAWAFHSSCTPATSSSATVTVSVPVNTVFYAAHTVTDSAGTAATHYSLVAVVEPDHTDLKPCRITRHTARAEGQQIGLELDAPLPFATYPDGTEVLIAKTEWFGDTADDLAGIAGRKQMIFSGWIDEEEHEGRATEYGFRGRLALTCLDGAGWLAKLPGFPTIVERESSPAQWEHMKGATINRYVHRILHAYSNILTRACFTWFTSGELPFPSLGSDGMSLYEQADQRTQAVAGKLTCDKHGRLMMKDDPMLAAIATRSSTVIVAIEERDWQQYRYRFTKPPRTHWNWGEAIGSAAIDAADVGEVTTYFCVAPGEAPGQGLGNETSGQQLVVSQAALNEREGHRYAARMNNPYGYIEVTLRGGDAGVEPALMEWVRFQVTSATAGPRGRTFSTSTDRFLPVEVSYEYNAESGMRTCRVSLEKEVQGQPAVTYYPPQDAYTPVPWPINPYPDIWFPGHTDIWLRGGTDRIALICDNGLARTTNFGAGDATVWDWQSWGSFGISQRGYTAAPDAFSYQSGPVKAWVLFSGPGSVYLVDIANRTAALKTNVAPAFSFHPGADGANVNGGGSIDASFAEPNIVAVVAHRGFAASGLTYTTDGAAWSSTTVPGGSSPRGCGGVFVSSRTPGKLVVGSAEYGDWFNGGLNGDLYASSNYGATIAKMSGPLRATYNPACLGSPWDSGNNADEHLLFFSSGRGGSMGGRFYRASGSTQTVISPVVSGEYYFPLAPRNGWSTAINNANRLLLAGADQNISAPTRKLFLTNNALAATPTWAELTGTGGVNYGCVAIAGDNGNTFYFWGGMQGTLAAVACSLNGGATIVSQVGNLAGFSPGEVRMLVGW